MGELASLGRASALLREVGALPNVLFIAVKALFAVAQYRKVATHALACAYIHMRERTLVARTPTLVEKVETQRRTFRSGVVG